MRQRALVVVVATLTLLARRIRILIPTTIQIPHGGSVARLFETGLTEVFLLLGSFALSSWRG